jgi:poly-beta-hydroxyalkanoate depolymerase
MNAPKEQVIKMYAAREEIYPRVRKFIRKCDPHFEEEA